MDHKWRFCADEDVWACRAAWWPCAGFAVAIGVLGVTDAGSVYRLPYVLPALNITFLTVVSFTVFVLAANSYLVSRSISFFFLACGAFALGAGATFASFPLAGRGANWTVTIYNTSACLAAVFHFVSVVSGVRGTRRGVFRPVYAGFPVVAFAILAILVGEILLAACVHNGKTPTFFVNGQGATPLDKAVLWASAAMFGASAYIMLKRHRRRPFPFSYWYGLGLMLIAMGLVGVSVQTRFGSPLSWVSRSSQYLGGVYMFIAVLSLVRSGTRWRISVEDALHEAEQRYHALDESARFAFATINALSANICVLDREGVIVAVNKAWRDFARANGCEPDAVSEGTNYLRVADEATGDSSGEGRPFAEGIRKVLRGDVERFMLEYPCHSPEEQRWFVGRVTLLQAGEMRCAVVAHEDITERKRAEEALRESEERYRSLVTTTMEAVLLTIPSGHILSANTAACQMFGFSQEEFVGLGRASVVDESDPRLAAALEERERTGRFCGELTLKRKDGTRFPGEISSAFFVLPNGERRTSMVIRDVTAYRCAEEALRNNEKRLRVLFSALQAGVLVQAKDGRIIQVNRVASEIFGMTEDEILGKTSLYPRWHMIDESGAAVPGEQHPSMITLNTGMPVRNAVRGLFADEPRRFHWLLINTEPMVRDDTGAVAEVLVAFLDITSLKQVEAELRAELEFAEGLLATAQTMVMVLDLEGRIVRFNPYMEEISGYRLDEVKGKDWFGTFLPSAIRERVRALFCQAIADIQTRGNVDVMLTKQGEERLIEWYDKTLKDADGKVVGLLAVGQDVTERKRAEDALMSYQKRLQSLALALTQTEEAERRRIAVHLHDQVGQSLAAIRVRLAAWKGAKPSQRETLLADVEHLIDETIDDIRKLTFDLSPPILYELGLGAALEQLGESMCKKEGLIFAFQDDGKSVGVSRSVAAELYRMARELMLNVFKHASAKRMSLSVSVDGRDVCLEVSDDGVGLDSDKNATIASGMSGTFGLFSIRERVREMDGAVDIRSAPGQGTRITVRVPCVYTAGGGNGDTQ